LGYAEALNPDKSGFNGDDRDRTGNLWLAKPTLSQLSYVPVPAKREIPNPKS
jgi:hypothetical protein